MKSPTIPMSPSQLPQQRIVPVADLATRPVPFDAVVGWDEKPDGVELFSGPARAVYLGTVEWAWSPMNNRIDCYYLSRGRTHWMLWIHGFDDNEGGWTWLAVGHVPRKQASRTQAAIHLLADFWRMEKEDNELDHYHWINEEAFLDVSEWRTIALQVWPEVAAQRILQEDEGEDI
jgi:hypothetical protein